MFQLQFMLLQNFLRTILVYGGVSYRITYGKIRKILNLHTLKPYFQNKSTFKAALYAMITVLIIVVIIMQTFKLYYNKTLPENTNETILYLLLTFVVGYIADILIHKLNIFPKLKLYYKVIGSGLWGGLAILFSVSTSLLLLYLYNRYNDEQ